MTIKDENLQRAREHVAVIGAALYERHLTDAAGGNLSLRITDSDGNTRILITSRYAGSKRRWSLEPEHVLVFDADGNQLDGDGVISREGKVHLKLHRDFGAHGTAVIHCHARNVLVFAAMASPIAPVLEGTLKFGEIPVCEYAPSHTDALAEYVAAKMQGQEERIKSHAAGVLAPYHGLFMMGKDLDATFDAVERVDTNAYCILMGGLLAGDALAAQKSRFNAALEGFRQSKKS
jgi:L-fuculose-phosphate aldolase